MTTTDSLFVLLPGASKEDAFRIGQAIADRVTFLSPPPVKLKFEKVYFPCFLETKKRYVGFSYETLGQQVRRRREKERERERKRKRERERERDGEGEFSFAFCFTSSRMNKQRGKEDTERFSYTERKNVNESEERKAAIIF